MSDDDFSEPGDESPSFTEYTAELAKDAQSTGGVKGLVLLGSASRAASSRRDQWSDHDFYALLDPGLVGDLRRRLPFLPRPEHIALVACEGVEGFAVLYDDGHLLEFGAGTTEEFGSSKFDQHEILFADADTVEWVSRAVQRGAAYTPEPAAEAAGLALVKLMIGFGRAKRGELISGSLFVRCHAITHLTSAIRQRITPATQDADPFDPTRRFETAYPAISRRIASALEAPITDAAREILAVLRSELEPGWMDFPTAAANIVASRFTDQK